MRFYTQEHRFYAGIDLHARTMHLCVLDHAGSVVCDKNLPSHPDALLRALAPFRDGLVVGVEFAWYSGAAPSIWQETISSSLNRPSPWAECFMPRG